MIKKIIAWPVSWILFWYGHYVSRLLVDTTPCSGLTWVAYKTYNKLMVSSCRVQDWAYLEYGPWEGEE